MASEEEGFRIVRPPRAQPPEPTTYINGVAVTVSPWDFCLMFSRALPTDPLVNDPQAQIGKGGARREVAMQGEVVQRIVMSPEHAKAMAAQLAQNIVLFESEFGPIPQPQPEPEPVAKSKAQRKARARRK
jgi:hypothetical protein